MSSRLEKSIEKMARFCPNLAFETHSPLSNGGGAWSGPIQPIASEEGLHLLLDDVRHNRPVYCAPRGELRHLAACQSSHCPTHGWIKWAICGRHSR